MWCGPVLLLTALLLGTGTAVPLTFTENVQLQENFDLNQSLGVWFSIASAGDCPWYESLWSKMKMTWLTISPTEATDIFSAVLFYNWNGKCANISGEYEALALPGHFKYISPPGSGIEVDIQIIRSNYHEYSIILYHSKIQGNRMMSLNLYGRTQTLREELLQHFKEFALKQGIPATKISFLPKQGKCVSWDTTPLFKSKGRAQRSVGDEDEEGSAFGPLTNITRGEDSCQLAHDAGPCFGFFPRYHYNQSSMTCEKFTFGGCLGNRNNFVSDRECLQTCRTVAACRLPIEAGPCISSIDLWAFDSVIGKCIAFKYGGCQGNGNKFYTLKECEEYCDAVPEGEDEFLIVPMKV
ncbi:protein AMBP [Heptranchias perlo]|uniref:protein AMBP n=1 Tax=Heptranchias perlo TaxID=212740 RepID=UPI00355AAB42